MARIEVRSTGSFFKEVRKFGGDPDKMEEIDWRQGAVWRGPHNEVVLLLPGEGKAFSLKKHDTIAVKYGEDGERAAEKVVVKKYRGGSGGHITHNVRNFGRKKK